MAKDNFDASMVELFKHEGGYVNHKKDPGGETNFGISKRSYPSINIKALTKERAKRIYKTDFWDPIQGDKLPAGIDFVTFDPSVNSGRKRGVGWLQAALGVKADGQLGPATLAAALKADRVAVIQKACAKRAGWLKGLKTWSTFGKGWARRVAEVEAAAVRMSFPTADKGTGMAMLQSHAFMARRDSDKETGKALGISGGGIGGASVADIPAWEVYILIAVVAILVIQFMGNRVYHKQRVAAYKKEAENVAAL